MVVVIFLLGLCVGSFLNVVIDRLPHERSIIKGRSHCEHCKKTLAWFDLIPLVSFLFLKGKCRHCHKFFGWHYIGIELLTGVLFVITAVWFFSNHPQIFNFQFLIFNLVYYFFIVSSLIAIFFIDLKHGIIPDKIVYPAIAISFLFQILNSPASQRGEPFSILNSLLSALGAFAFFLLLYLGTKGKGMGLGDVKFSFLLGLILGFPLIVVGLYVAFLTGAIISIILILWRKKRFSGGTIPFGPFLVFGTLVALFFGKQLLSHILAFYRF
ncbi:MAG TPA: prepilin peptidase [Candidatus Saccharimonadales bacterium]|nr:prepilin peptidase [Candidatus Saccharimonadales bacterium]